jgi:hydroxymethylbilane synthase
VGTSSSRRACLLHSLRPDLKVEPLRGNVGTRLRKLDEGQYDAIILAAAGLKRLGESRRIRCYLEADTWIPAVGQGAIGIECREKDFAVLALLSPLDHVLTRTAVLAERACNRALNGGCQLPIAVHAVCAKDQLILRGFVGDSARHQSVRAELTGVISEPEMLGGKLANVLLEKGAGRILEGLV